LINLACRKQRINPGDLILAWLSSASLANARHAAPFLLVKSVLLSFFGAVLRAYLPVPVILRNV
jgi:hypothetical protein